MEHQDTDCSREDVLAYTWQWYYIVNRGGLYPIHDVAFLFFVDVSRRKSCTVYAIKKLVIETSTQINLWFLRYPNM